MTLRSVEPALPLVDPGFDATAFLEQTRAAFYTVKRAWAQLRPEICRHVMVEDLWQSQRAQMEVFRLDGCRSVLDGITVVDAAVSDAITAGTDDRIEVALHVSGRDYVVRSATGEVVRGDPGLDSWREAWTMQRSRDGDGPALRSIKCPECGSPLELDPDGLCGFCHAVVPGAKRDWLVVDMSHPTNDVDGAAGDSDQSHALLVALNRPESPWSGRGPMPLPIDNGAEPGIEAIRAHDPGFAPGDFLARARETFIRVDAARNELTPEAVRPMVGDAFYAAEVSRAEAARAGGRNQVEAFLDVESVHLVAGGSADGSDRLVVRVTAASAAHVIDVNAGVMVAGDNSVRRWCADLAFQRRSGVASDPTRGTGAPVCGHCGEVGSVGADGVCAACGIHVTGGEWDWVLVSEVRVPG
jgi:predicted lipid-binding transport protein (Tim44 family)